jgi:hypothetical protein
MATLSILFLVCFFPGLILFGIATQRAQVLPPRSGILMVIGSPLYLVGFVLGLIFFEAFWTVAILGGLALGSGLAWAGYSLWSYREEAVLQPTG